MAYEIDLQVESAVSSAARERLLATAQVALREEEVASGALTLLITDDAHIRQLNRDFLGQDQPTDVLSFPSGEPLTPGAEAIPYLGDIAISVPTAQIQADAGGHELVAELQLLAVHGILHLLGYDHETAEQKAEMWAQQAAILAALGLAGINPTES